MNPQTPDDQSHIVAGDELDNLLHRFRYPEHFLPVIHDHAARSLKKIKIQEQALAALQSYIRKQQIVARLEELQAFPGRAPYSIVGGPFTTVDGRQATLTAELHKLEGEA